MLTDKVSCNLATWWRHQMETFSALLALCAVNSQRPVSRSFDVFFDLCLIKRLSKHLRGWWFETPSRPLWHHCNDKIVIKKHLWSLYEIKSLSVKSDRFVLLNRWPADYCPKQLVIWYFGVFYVVSHNKLCNKRWVVDDFRRHGSSLLVWIHLIVLS